MNVLVWVQVLNTDYSALVAASCMNRLAKLSARFIGNRGFSIGIDDVTPAPRLVEKKQQTVSTGYEKVQEFIKDYSKGHLKLEPGCDPEQSLEKVVTDVLNDIREKAAKVRKLCQLPVSTHGCNSSAYLLCTAFAHAVHQLKRLAR